MSKTATSFFAKNADANWPSSGDEERFDVLNLTALTAEELVDGLAREIALIDRLERKQNVAAIALWNAIQQRRNLLDSTASQRSRDAA